MCRASNNNNGFCIEFDQASYVVYQSEGNWYEAITKCALRNATLAVIPPVRQIAFLELISKRKKKWANIWIGLRYEDYFVQECNGGKFLKQYILYILKFDYIYISTVWYFTCFY